MPTLSEEAAAAFAAEQAAVEAGRESVRKERRTAAASAVRAVLTRPDGTTVTMTQAGLSPVASLTDPIAGQVVWTDGALHLAALFRRDEWRVFLVRPLPDGTIERLSDRLRDLADLGAAMAGAQ